MSTWVADVQAMLQRQDRKGLAFSWYLLANFTVSA